MCAFAPPGRGYAYGDTIPIFNFSFLFSDPSSRSLHRVAHHRAPLLCRDPIQVLAERPVSSVRSCRAILDRAPQGRGVIAFEVGPRGPDQLRVVRVARARLRDVQHLLVEPSRARSEEHTSELQSQ